MEFLKAIRELRRDRGLTQAALADLAGMHQSDISMIESGKSNASAETLHSICAALDCEVILVPRRIGGDVQRMVDRHLNRHQEPMRPVMSVADEMRIPDGTD
ncbi:MAG: Transcriptional regulator [Rhizobium sp.]|nr:Transcriptional regulator [Rhizobium sp.]